LGLAIVGDQLEVEGHLQGAASGEALGEVVGEGRVKLRFEFLQLLSREGSTDGVGVGVRGLLQSGAGLFQGGPMGSGIEQYRKELSSAGP